MAHADFEARLNRLEAKTVETNISHADAAPKQRSSHSSGPSIIVLFLVAFMTFFLGIAGGMFSALALDPDVTPEFPNYWGIMAIAVGVLVVQLALIGLAAFKRFRSKMANATMMAFLAGVGLVNIALSV